MADTEFFPGNTLYKSMHKIMGNKSIFDKKPSEMLRTWTVSLSGILLFLKRKGTRVKSYFSFQITSKSL